MLVEHGPPSHYDCAAQARERCGLAISSHNAASCIGTPPSLPRGAKSPSIFRRHNQGLARWLPT